MSNGTSDSGPAFVVYDYNVAGIAIFILALIGFTANLLVVLFMRHAQSLANSFGSLTLSQAVADLVHQAAFAFVVAPIIFFQIQPFLKIQFTSWIGFTLILSYEVCGFSHLCISFNRFCAVYFPVAYKTIYSPQNTRIIIVVCWALAILPNIYFIRIADCANYLPEGTWIFGYLKTPICDFVLWYVHFVKYIVFVVCFATFDIATLIRIHASNQQIVGGNQRGAAQRRRQEKFFVWQVCLQGVFFLLELITYYGGHFVVTGKWTLFFLTTIMWILVHCIDGVITLACNSELRKLIGLTRAHRITATSSDPAVPLNSVTAHAEVDSIRTPRTTVASVARTSIPHSGTPYRQHSISSANIAELPRI